MAGKGRPRKPASILKLSGSHRADARAEAEPTMAPGEIEAPTELMDATARKWWKRLTGQLGHAPGLLTADNSIALALLCQAISTYQEANDQLGREGLIVETAKGETKRNPLLIIRENAFREVRMGCAQFGITPADRSSITTTSQGPTDEGSKYLA